MGMGINSLIRYVIGNVTFSARNGFFERLINLCSSNNIILWDFHKNEEGFTARCTAKDYKKVQQLAEKVNVEITIQKNRGLVFKAIKYHKRWGIIAGILAFLVFILLTQFYVWDIEVTGNTTVPESVILDELSELGVHKMSFIPSIDFRLKKQQALLKLPQLSWMAINQNGCKLLVNVTERKLPPEIEESTPCNVVAIRSGKIKYMEVYNGDKAVAVNDTVNKGDILVNSVYTSKQGKTIYVHASAKVIAEVSFDKTISLDLSQVTKKYTGKTKTRYFLNLFSFKLPLFIAVPIKGDYDVQAQSSPMMFFGKELPIGIYSIHYTFYEKETENINLEKARQILSNGFLQYEATNLTGCAILSKSSKESVKNGTVSLTTSYTVEQNIAKQVQI